MTCNSVVISSGHGLYVRGASGILDEVNEARIVVEMIGDMLTWRGVNVKTFHDDESQSQNENLNRIVDYHNSQDRELPVYRPQTNNDIIWCFGTSSMEYHCSTAALIGLVE